MDSEVQGDRPREPGRGDILVTGAAGFIGVQLVPALAKTGYRVVALDRLICSFSDPGIVTVVCDLQDKAALSRVFADHHISQVVHLATELNFAVKSQKILYNNNIAMTINLIEAARRHAIQGLVFISTFAIYSGLPGDNPISENVVPQSIDEYGKSKIACEALLVEARAHFPVSILRSQLVLGGGRVGMLSVLFDLIAGGHPLFVLRQGQIRHHCLATADALAAIKLCVANPKSLTVNLGSAEVKTFRECFEDLISHAGSRTRIVEIGSWWSIPLLKVLFLLKLSPLGPHQFRMLTEDCVLRIDLAEKELGWRPGTGHLEMMREAYDQFLVNRDSAKVVSRNSKPVKARLLGLLRFFG